MRLASAAWSRCPVALGLRVRWKLATIGARQSVKSSARPSSLLGTNSILCSSKASAGAYFADQTKFSENLHNITRQFLEMSPDSSKDISWKKAKMIVKEGLISIGYDVVKWFLVTVLVFSFISDVFLAVSANRELLVPLGLFVGVMLADFLKESCHQFFESMEQRGNDMQKWGMGLLLVSIRFVFISFRIRGWMLLSHIANGALMQIVWPANEQQKSLQDQERGIERPAAPKAKQL